MEMENFLCLLALVGLGFSASMPRLLRCASGVRLFVFFSFALFGGFAFAEDYYWKTSNQSTHGRTYKSAIESCRADFPITSPWGPTIYYHSTIVFTNIATCVGVRGKGPEGILSTWRYGKSCPAGTTYNPTTGACTKDPGKGNDPGTGCSGNGGPSPNQADPINTSNGNSIQAEVDYPSANPSTLDFTRTYNSLDGLWRHNYSTYLRIAASAVALVMADGRESFFTLSGSTVTASSTELGRLTKNGDTWLYTAKNNDTYSFDAAGRLTRWSNAAGAEYLLSYVNGTVTVTDKLGQSLSFTEDAQHQPLSLDAPGLTIQYDYNANERLSKLVRTRGGQTEQRLYHYEKPNKPNLLTGITDERGVRYTTWTFDDQDRATSSEHSGGVEHIQITYNPDGSSTVTNEFGKKSTYRFVTIGGVKRVSAIEGEALGNCPMSNSTFTYDERGQLKTKADNKGNLTTYTYNARGLETSRTEASGTPQARTITTDWHADWFLPVTITEPDRITQYTYDNQGRQTSQSVIQR